LTGCRLNTKTTPTRINKQTKMKKVEKNNYTPKDPDEDL
jgi:hypothetical protein